jgi:putative oxidoreductase
MPFLFATSWATGSWNTAGRSSPSGPDSFTAILHAMGMPLPGLLAWVTIVVELIGGVVVLIGAFIPLTSIPMAGVLLVAIFTVHMPNGFSSIKLQSFDATGAHFRQPGYEADLLYLAGLIALRLGGSGFLLIRRQVGTA